MKTIIAGSRELGIGHTLAAMAACPWKITGVVSGMCRGPDTYGLNWAKINKIPYYTYPANWRPAHLHGKMDKAAGFKRNIVMAENAEALLAVWDGVSNGTAHMIREAVRRNLKVFKYIVKDE